MNKVYVVSGDSSGDHHVHTGLQFKANSQNYEKRLLLRNTTSNEKCTYTIKNSSQNLTIVSKRPTNLSQTSPCGWEQETWILGRAFSDHDTGQ